MLFLEEIICLYPGIYAEGYIVFVFLFISLFVRSFVLPSIMWYFALKFSRVVHISATTYQKAFIFGP